MPHHIRFFIKHILIGCGIAALFVALLLAYDVQGLRSMIWHEELWYVAIFMLWFGNASVFGAVQVAWAVMAMAED